MLRKNDLDPERFVFRGLHPDVFLGTASDRYAGWIGQVYSEEFYRRRISRRTKKVGKRSFVEEVLPLDCVQEYFQHFRVLEIDFTFYGPLINEEGKPTQSHHTLRSYRDFLTVGDTLILKAPQIIFAQKIRQGTQYVKNPAYLNPELFAMSFFEPAADLLGPHLNGIVFEQEYQRKEDRLPVMVLAEELDRFLEAIPSDVRYHVELRTEGYLTPPVFRILEKHGVGQVLSHWTWLPSLQKQFEKAGRRFLNSGKHAVVRLMTPMGVRYEDAYAQAHPFDRLMEKMLQPRMVEETVRLMQTGIEQGVRMNVIVNNRAGGNAPLIAQKIARQFMEGPPPPSPVSC